MMQDEDMPDQVRAKLHKLTGLLLMQSESEENKSLALENLMQATRLNPDAGVKKEIDALRRASKKSDANATNSKAPRKRAG
jgi:hypothetical protein